MVPTPELLKHLQAMICTCQATPTTPLPCTFAIDSNADTYEKIREELRTTKRSERSVRAQDQESEDAFEKLRRDGYM